MQVSETSAPNGSSSIRRQQFLTEVHFAGIRNDVGVGNGGVLHLSGLDDSFVLGCHGDDRFVSLKKAATAVWNTLVQDDQPIKL